MRVAMRLPIAIFSLFLGACGASADDSNMPGTDDSGQAGATNAGGGSSQGGSSQGSGGSLQGSGGSSQGGSSQGGGGPGGAARHVRRIDLARRTPDSPLTASKRRRS